MKGEAHCIGQDKMSMFLSALLHPVYFFTVFSTSSSSLILFKNDERGEGISSTFISASGRCSILVWDCCFFVAAYFAVPVAVFDIALVFCATLVAVVSLVFVAATLAAPLRSASVVVVDFVSEVAFFAVGKRVRLPSSLHLRLDTVGVLFSFCCCYSLLTLSSVMLLLIFSSRGTPLTMWHHMSNRRANSLPLILEFVLHS